MAEYRVDKNTTLTTSASSLQLGDIITFGNFTRKWYHEWIDAWRDFRWRFREEVFHIDELRPLKCGEHRITGVVTGSVLPGEMGRLYGFECDEQIFPERSH